MPERPEELAEEITRALGLGRYDRARHGGIYIPRRGKKSIIITNIPFSQAANLASNLEELKVTSITELPNVILVKVRAVVRDGEETVAEPATIRAPSGMTIKTNRVVVYSMRLEIPSGRIVGKEPIHEEYAKVDVLTSEERRKIEALRKRLDELYNKLAKLSSERGSILNRISILESEVAYIHEDDGGLLVEEGYATMEHPEHRGSTIVGTVYRCTKCNATVTIFHVPHYVKLDEGDSYSWVETIIRPRGFRLREVPLIDVDREARQRYENLRRQLAEAQHRIDELYGQIEQVVNQIRDVYRAAAERLGLRIVQYDETEGKYVFNDGTVYYAPAGGASFFEGSPLFRAIEQADKIYGSLVDEIYNDLMLRALGERILFS